MSLDLGPCQMYFGTKDSEVSIGKTQGGVRATFSEDEADLLSDQYGTQPEDQVVTGQAVNVVVPMADFTLDNLAIALNQTVKTYDGKDGIAGASLVGTKRSTEAESLLLKKFVNGVISTNTEDWIRFPKAAPKGNIEIVYDGAGQRIFEVTFQGYPDDADNLYYLGDETAAVGGS